MDYCASTVVHSVLLKPLPLKIRVGWLGNMRAISATKREANNRIMDVVFEAGKKELSAPSKGTAASNKRGAKISSTL
jgi:hypothetical protein